MRLHCQPGLSSRVLQALRTRLERTLKMAEEGRARSRSRGREAAESETPDMPEGAPGVPEEAQGMPEGTPGDMAAVPGMPEGTPGDMAAVLGMPEGNPGDMAAMPGMPEGIPGVMTATPPLAPNGMELLNLAKRISECATKIGNVTENLAIALDDFNQGRMELHKGFKELSEQIKNTAHCITTMTSGVSFQSGEITKLLKAFDRWAATGRWALAGSQTVETNIQGVQGEVEKQAKKLEASMNSGFESLSGHIQELVKLLREQPQGMAIPGAIPVSEGATETETPLTPGAIGAPAVGAPVMGTPGSTGRAGSTSSGGVPLPGTGSISSGGLPLPGSAPGAHVTTTLPPPALPVSLFMAFCPEQPNGPRPSTPLPIPTPCQRAGIVTRDAGTGVQRTLSPTAYRPEQLTGITSAWAPQGLGMIRDGNSQFRRIY